LREIRGRAANERSDAETAGVLLAKLVGRWKARRLGERFGETRVGREVERRDLIERFRYFSPREPVRQDVDRAEKGRIAAIDDSSVRNFRREESDASSVRSVERPAETAGQINGVEVGDRRFRRFAKKAQTGSNRADRKLEAANVALR
jgi:hypothetical protein